MTITLRSFRETDFEAFHAIVSDYDVVKMTSSWPYPAEPAFTRMRMTTPEALAGIVNVIDVDDTFAGVVGIVRDDLGYLIGQDFWGKGIMTSAVQMRVARHFALAETDHVKACIWEDNPASGRVLEKIGLNRTIECSDFCKARNTEIKAIHYELTRAEWQRRAGGS